MVSLARSFGFLVEAFADFIEPVVAPFLAGSRWVAVEDGDAVSLFELSRRGPVPLGKIDGDADGDLRRRARGKDVELRLDPRRVVSRAVQLPATGRDYAESIIQNRLERLTPWSPDTVLFGFALDEATDSGPLVTFDFAATSRDLVEPTLERLRAGGIVPAAMGPAGGPLDAPLRIDLFRGRNDRARQRLRKLAGWVLVLVAALVIPLLGGSYWLAYGSAHRLEAASAEAASLDAKLLAAARGQAEDDPGLRLLQAKRPDTAMVFALDRLATALPDDTYLTELDMTPDELHLTGISANAPALIPLLDSQAGISDVSFSAPVVRNAEGYDVFEVAAKRAAAAEKAP